MSDTSCYDDFDYDRVKCPQCGSDFNNSEIVMDYGIERCLDCGADLEENGYE